jgi:hypothetical protein
MPEIFICHQGWRKDLERYLTPEPLILGPEHNRHPTLADLFLEAVPGDP